MVEIFPSLIAADPLKLGQDIQLLDPHVEGYHIDVMDFHFVPNLTIGPDVVNAMRRATKKPLLVHLMVEYPERYFDRLFLNNKDIVAIHSEAPSEMSPTELIQTIKTYGYTPSLAINPETDVQVLTSITTPLEHVLLMSVNPGFSGQAFMPLVYDKIPEVLKLGPYTIAIDGGVNKQNAQKLFKAGAQQLVVGSAIFDEQDPLKALQEIRQSIS